MLEVRAAGYIYREKRNSVRKPVESDAKGIISKADTVIDCTVLDISETGELVQLGVIDIIPQDFKLYAPETHMLCECRVVRKSGKYLGLEFVTSVALDHNDEVP